MAVATEIRRMTAPSKMTLTGALLVLLAGLTALVIASPAGASGPSVPWPGRFSRPQIEANQTYSALQRNLYQPLVSLYQGLPSSSWR